MGDFITPEILEQAQSTINSISNSSLQWIEENLQELKNLYESMIVPKAPMYIADEMSTIALVINSRSGTFGYSRAKEIAYNLYLFTRNKLDVQNQDHQIIVNKHILVLQIIFGNKMRGDAGILGAEVATELRSLIDKYANA